MVNSANPRYTQHGDKWLAEINCPEVGCRQPPFSAMRNTKAAASLAVDTQLVKHRVKKHHKKLR